MAKKATSNEVLKEYRKQRARVLQFVNRASKKGWIFPETTIPKIPKTVTEGSVRRLQKLTPNNLYKKATYDPENEIFVKVDPSTGDSINIVTGELVTKPRIEVVDIDYVPNDDTLVINGLISALLGFPTELTKPLIDLINSIRQTDGDSDVAEAIRNMPDTFHDTLMRHKNDSKGAVDDFAQSIIDYLPQADSLKKEELQDLYNELEGGFDI